MNETPESRAAPAGAVWPRWTKILLFSSLALNLLVAGMVAGAVLRAELGGAGGPGRADRADRAEPAVMRELGYGPYLRALTPQQRRDLSRAIRERSGDLRANRQELRRQMETLLEALRSSPFDAELVARILAAQQRKLFEQHEIGLRILLSGLEQMSDEQRAAYADRLERVLRAPTRKGR